MSPAWYSFLSGMSVTSSCWTSRDGITSPPDTQRVSSVRLGRPLFVGHDGRDAVGAALRGVSNVQRTGFVSRLDRARLRADFGLLVADCPCHFHSQPCGGQLDLDAGDGLPVQVGHDDVDRQRLLPLDEEAVRAQPDVAASRVDQQVGACRPRLAVDILHRCFDVHGGGLGRDDGVEVDPHDVETGRVGRAGKRLARGRSAACPAPTTRGATRAPSGRR